MMQLKTYQAKAVEELISETVKLFKRGLRRQTLLLKAPTGAGKTVMMAEYLSELVFRLPTLEAQVPKEVAIIWLAPNTLHLQSYNRLSDFYESLRRLNVIKHSDLSQTILQPNDLLFLNWSSINKTTKNLFRKENENGHNLDALIENTLAAGTEIILVVDEAHLTYGTGKSAKDVLDIIDGRLEILVTATPDNLRYMRPVEVELQDVIEEEMIKKSVRLNPGLDVTQASDGLRVELLNTALKQLEQLREAYKVEDSKVRPLLLIQMPNDDEEKLDTEEEHLFEVLERRLEQNHGITTANERMAVWLHNKRVNLDSELQPFSTVDVMFFKQAIAVGWDCTRAAILLIYRKNESFTFTVQVVGRIMRMPSQRHYSNDALNHGYVYTDLSKDMIQLVSEVRKYIEPQTAYRRSDYELVRLPSTFINRRTERNRLDSTYARVLHQTAERMFSIRRLDMVDFEAGADNRAKVAHQQIGFTWESARLEIPVPVNIDIDALEEGIILVDAAHSQRYTRNASEIAKLFRRWCRMHCGQYAAADSAPVLEIAMISLAELYFGIAQESDFQKIVLHKNNEPLWELLISASLEAFAQAKEEAAVKRLAKVQEVSWDVPEVLTASEDYEALQMESYAMDPFLQQPTASTPERNFAAFLEANREAVRWWYKNGDSGKDNFAIPYVKASTGIQSLFYVDFIVHFANGAIGLFDTKTKGSDSDAPAKQNGLVGYIRNHSAEGKQMVGGILIQEGSNWFYPQGEIADTLDTKGWLPLTLSRFKSDN